ncbi:DUF397 domain-containing protein [Pseudonocardia sp. NPDC046786]|uniref:DUF397 domain-containing protein n=1 Tax=Pseudonocardia sp. NPDC046786 TaxID=3155471 RepID=UPI0033F5BAA6
MIPVTDLSDLNWRKSSFSNGNNGECVEVADIPGGGRAVRDTKDHGRGPVLTFTPGEWTAFVNGAKAGEFD